MTLTVTDARLLVFGPHNDAGGGPDVEYDEAASAADHVIHGDDIDAVDLAEKANDRIDSATLSIDNYNGQYTGTFTRSDRLSLWLETTISDDYATDTAGTRPTATQFGEARYGDSRYSYFDEPLYTPDLSHRWTGMVTNATNNHQGGRHYTIDIDAGDYVFQLLKDRRHTYNYEGRALSGTDTAILNRALREDASELDRSQLYSLNTSTDIEWNRRTLLDLLKVCLARGAGVARAEDTSLLVTPSYELDPKFEISHESGDWYAGMSANSPPDEFANHLLVVGGTEPIEDDTQETHDTTITLSTGTSGRREIQIQPKGDKIAKVEVWTDPSVAADGTIQGSGLVARIQRDQGGAPVAPGNKERDLASGQISVEDLTVGGWTSIDISDGSVSRDTAWLILQTKGGDQTIGARDNGDGTYTATYRTFYPYDVAVERSDWPSRDTYGRVDDAIADDSLGTAAAAEDAAQARLARRGDIPHVIDGVRAWSERMHSLRVASLVTVDAPRLTDRGGDYVATERSTTIAANELQTEFVLEELATL